MQLTQVPMTQADLAHKLTLLSAGTAGPVVIRNNLPGIATFTDENTKIQTIWEGRGDKKGGDVKEVSPVLLQNPQFREQILRGIFEVVDNDANPDVLANALNAQRASWELRQIEALSASAEIAKANDTVIATGQPCIAPKGRELCGSYSLVMGKDPSQEPPLCEEHKKLAPLYTATQTGRLVDGKPEVVWKRA